MAKFSLNIVTDSAAIAEDGREFELARILRAVPQRIEDGETSGTLRDINGVNVGSWEMDLPAVPTDPDQVPGRTMTKSEMAKMCDMYGGAYETGFSGAGGTVVPDPEPTNAELLAIYLGLHDLDAITQAGVAEFARQLDADGVKAPEADDDGN